MAKYQQKPIVVDAFQFTGDYQAAFAWAGQWHDENGGPGVSRMSLSDSPVLCVDSGDVELEDAGSGGLWVAKGGWLVHGIDGKLRKYTNDVFEKMYEPAEPKEKTREQKS